MSLVYMCTSLPLNIQLLTMVTFKILLPSERTHSSPESDIMKITIIIRLDQCQFAIDY